MNFYYLASYALLCPAGLQEITKTETREVASSGDLLFDTIHCHFLQWIYISQLLWLSYSCFRFPFFKTVPFPNSVVFKISTVCYLLAISKLLFVFNKWDIDTERTYKPANTVVISDIIIISNFQNSLVCIFSKESSL